MQHTDTIVAPATPAGESALAVVRISGPGCSKIARECFRGEPPPPRLCWHADYRSIEGEVLDDVVFAYFAGPNSYTGEDSFEISCHGSPLIVSQIVQDLIRRGLRLAEPGEFTRRAFLNGRLDLTEAEAVMDLIRARSDRALDVARRQLRGALRTRIDALVSRLLDLTAAVEAQMDFPEEDLPAANVAAWAAETSHLRQELEALAATRQAGERLREGIKVVLAGAPNAGKSSLLNRLVGFERAIVSPEPGTTRDFLEERLTLGGHHIRIFDTAGLRAAATPVEQAGVERTLTRLDEADVVVLVADGQEEPPRIESAVLDKLAAAEIVVAANKSDLGARRWEKFPFLSAEPIDASAISGDGVRGLQAALVDAVNRVIGSDQGAEAGLYVNARHEVCLREAGLALRRAEENLQRHRAIELMAEDLRDALRSVGDIVGRVDHEQVLDRVFATFCIGK